MVFEVEVKGADGKDRATAIVQADCAASAVQIVKQFERDTGPDPDADKFTFHAREIIKNGLLSIDYEEDRTRSGS